MAAMDPETMARAAQDTARAKQSVDNNLVSLKGVCDDLAAGWTGRGATAFNNVMTTWDAEAAKLLDALQDIADNLDKSGTAQAEMDDESYSDISMYDGEL